MNRVQLFEIEDQPWLPRSLRDAMTDYLQFAQLLVAPYRAIAPRLADAIEHTGDNTIIDLGAGGGGPWARLLPLIDERIHGIRVLLTDKFPNVMAFAAASNKAPAHISFTTVPIDASAVPSDLKGFRTLFSAFHHYSYEQARAVLADAVKNQQGIAVFEATRRDRSSIASMALTPLIVLLTTPLIQPLRFSRLLWTYVIPAMLVVVPFDGIISCLRTYSVEELHALIADVPGSNAYTWEIGEEAIPNAPTPITFLIGYPIEPGSARSAR